MKFSYGFNPNNEYGSDIAPSMENYNIMLPLIHTSKKDYLISPQYDTFCNFLSPLELGLLIA